MSSVYIVQRPVQNKFGWVPDLSDATRYGTLNVVFEPQDKPQYLPGPSLHKARSKMKNFCDSDYLLWGGGGDPIAVMICTLVASENASVVNVLRWERAKEGGERDRRKGWYLPVTIELRKVNYEESINQSIG
jgi:hypothetical protein